MFDIRDLNNPIAIKAYSLENIKIVKRENKSGYCYIYFSGNGLYEDTEDNFNQAIFLKDRYEWEKRNSSIPELKIFVRDIFKQWYIVGISKKCPSIDSMIDYLRNLSAGYKIVTVGCSAGGYMAVLAGIKLNAEMVINFSGQYDLMSRVKSNPLLRQFSGGKYCDISDMVYQASTPIFYFYPEENQDDRYQASVVKNSKNILAFPLKSSAHGIVVSKDVAVKILNMSLTDLQKLYSKVRGKNSIQLMQMTYLISGWTGIINAVLYNYIKAIYRFIKDKLLKVIR